MTENDRNKNVSNKKISNNWTIERINKSDVHWSKELRKVFIISMTGIFKSCHQKNEIKETIKELIKVLFIIAMNEEKCL